MGVEALPVPPLGSWLVVDPAFGFFLDRWPTVEEPLARRFVDSDAEVDSEVVVEGVRSVDFFGPYRDGL